MSAGTARRAGQLPEEVTEFVGREAELAQIAAALDIARLVTVTGPGGVGKTRVALRAADRARPLFADGVVLIELSGLRDAELLPNTVAAALGLPESTAGKTGIDLVLHHLRDSKTLLVLDTCEHLIDACAMLIEVILAEAPSVTVLATSRQPLDVPGENTYLLPPLPVPARTGPSRNAGARGSGDAVELFARRAADVLPGFRVTSANRDAVISLCRHLDGIPLALELAAVRMRALPLEELSRWLDNRFMIVTGSRRGVTSRHQTLRDAIGWSYDLCTPAEQVLWARLSTFAGAFDIDAAIDVCSAGDLTPAKVTEAVISLVDKSVLTREPASPAPSALVASAGGAGTGNIPGDVPAAAAPGTRYRLLDTIREFGAERLAASGAREAVRIRHFARYLAMARRFAEHFVGDDQIPQYRRLSVEHADIRTALEYALSDPLGSPERDRDGAALAISLWGYWQVSGLISEGRYWLGKVLDKFPGPSAERAWALIVRGYLGAVQGGNEAVSEAAEGTRIAEQAGDELGAARGHLYHMVALMSAGRHGEASAAGAEAEPRLRALGDRIGLHTLDVLAGQLYMFQGDVERALARAEEGLRRFGGARERWLTSYLHVLIGLALFGMPGEEMAATAAMGEALRTKYEIGDCVGTAYSLEILGWLAARDGQHARAAWLLGAAGPLWARAGGRLAGAMPLEQHHRDAEAGGRAELGDERYAALAAEGARRPLDLIVSLAIAGARDLPRETARGSRGAPVRARSPRRAP